MRYLYSSALARHLAIYSASRLAPALASFIFTIIVVQTLSPAAYGAYSLFLLPAMVAASFAGGFAGQPIMRFATTLSSESLSKALIKIPVLSSLVLLPIVIWQLNRGTASAGAIVLALILVPLSALIDTRRGYFVAFSKSGAVFSLDTLRGCASLVVLFVLIQQGVNGPEAPMAALVASAAIALTFVRAGKYRGTEATGMSINASYLRYGIWIAVWMVLIGAFPLAERILLERKFGLSTVGTYAAIADPLLAASSAGGSVLISALMPRFVSAWARPRDGEITRLVAYGLIGSAIVSLSCLIVGSVIVAVDWGQFAALLREHYQLGLGLLGAGTLWQVAIFLHKPLELQGRTDIMALCLGISFLVFFAISHWMLERFGVSGVVIAKTVAGLAYIGLVIVAVRIRGVRP